MDSLKIIIDIVHSTYMQNYLIAFTVFSLGCIAACYLLGNVLGKFPVINKIFTSTFLTNLIILIPTIVIIKSMIFKSGAYALVLERNLFLIIISTALLLILVFNARRQIFGQDDFSKLHSLPILLLMVMIIFYFKTTYSKDVNRISANIRQEIEKLQHENAKGIDIAKLVVEHYTLASHEKIQEFQKEQEKTIANYDKKFDEYNDRLKQSDSILKDLKNKYQTEQDQSLSKIEKKFDTYEAHIKKSDKDLSDMKDKYQREINAINEEKVKFLSFSQQASLKIAELNQVIDKYKQLTQQNEQNTTRQTFQIALNELHSKVDQLDKQLNEMKILHTASDNNLTQKISNLENDMNKSISNTIILQDKLFIKENNNTNPTELRDIKNSQ